VLPVREVICTCKGCENPVVNVPDYLADLTVWVCAEHGKQPEYRGLSRRLHTCACGAEIARTHRMCEECRLARDEGRRVDAQRARHRNAILYGDRL